jgi:hypothetical protein
MRDVPPCTDCTEDSPCERCNYLEEKAYFAESRQRRDPWSLMCQREAEAHLAEEPRRAAQDASAPMDPHVFDAWLAGELSSA